MAEATKQLHHTDCGEVGETGAHGDLGSNSVGQRAKGPSSYADLGGGAVSSQSAPAVASSVGAQALPEEQIAAGLVRAGYEPAVAKEMAKGAVLKAKA